MRETLPTRIVRQALGLGSPKVEDLQVLIDYLSLPAMLINGEAPDQVLYNELLYQVSGYHHKEDKEILTPAKLLPEVAWEELSHNQDHQTIMAMRNSREIQIILRATPLSAHSPWLLVTLQSLAEVKKQQSLFERQATLIENFYHLISLAPKEDASIEDILLELLEVGKRLLGAESLLLYKGDSEQPEMQLFLSVGPDELFPRKLTATDVIHLGEPSIWIPGQPPRPSLHRLASKSNLEYLASAPIGSGVAQIGLLVAAHSEARPQTSLLPWMKILAQKNHQLIKQHNQIQNAKSTLTEFESRNNRLAQVFTHAPQSVLIIDPQGTILEMNPCTEELLGYQANEVCGQPIREILVGSPDIEILLATAGKDPQQIHQAELSIINRKGIELDLQAQTIPVLLDGKLEGYILFLQDLSQAKRFQAEMRMLENQALVGLTAAESAHDIANIINNIQLGLQHMAGRKKETDPERAELVGFVKQLDRLHKSVRDLVVKEQSHFEPRPIDLSKLIPRVTSILRPRMERYKIKLMVHDDGGPHWIMGDPQSLTRALLNLMTNSLNAMKDVKDKEGVKGLLTIKVAREPNDSGKPQVVISITDTGPGIPPEIIQKIFQPFYTTEVRGSGLGLNIVSKIIKRHNGDIEVTSVPGATCFTLRFPEIYTSQR